MNVPPPLFPQPAPAAPNWRHALGGVWRLTFRRMLLPGHWLIQGIGLVVLTLLFIGGVHGGGPERFLGWTANFYVTFLVPALAFMVAAGAMRDEMKSGTVDYVLTRPVPRHRFVIFKYIAHTLCLQLSLLVAFGLVVAFAKSRHVPDLTAVAATLLFGQGLMIMAFSALGFLCGALTSRYIVIGLAYAGIIEAGVGQIPTQISRLSMTQQMRDLLAVLLEHGEAHAASPGLFATAGILLLFTVITLAAAAALFHVRELGAPAES